MPQKSVSFSVSLVALVSIWASLAAAPFGPTIEEATQRLTGGGSKEWVLKKFVTILGLKDECKDGEIWRFQSGGQIEVRECIEGKTRREKKVWQLRREDDLDLVVTVGDKEYTLLLPPKPGDAVEEMRLRIISTETTTPTVDLRFTHEHD